MKTFIAVVTIVALLGLSSAAVSPEQVQAEIDAYVGSQIFDLINKPGVARAGGGVACYDKYLPKITAAAESSKSDTETCISNAKARREDQLNKVKAERETLDGQVKTVSDTLSVCLAKTDDLEYLKCLKENSANLQTTIKEVGETSTSLSNNLSASYKNIDSSEDSCIKNVIAKSKTESDELLAALQNCLMNGLDGGSDAGSDEGSNGGSDAGSDTGSDESSDGGSDEGSNGGSDAGSDNGSDAGSDGGSDEGSNGGSDAGSDAGSDGGSNAGSHGDSDGSSDGSQSGSDGSIPSDNLLPEEQN